MKLFQKEWLNMLNNKAQSLVIFVLILPVALLFIGYVFDVVNTNYEKNKLENLSLMLKENLDEDITDNEIKELISKNDTNIIVSITRKENVTKVELSKRIKSLFGKIIGKEYYDISVATQN